MSDTVKRTASRNRSRSPSQSIEQQESCKEDYAESTNQKISLNQKETRYQSMLFITNIPERWHALDLKNFLNNLMNHENITKNDFYCVLKDTHRRKGIVKFPFKETALEVYKKLKGFVVEGKTLYTKLKPVTGLRASKAEKTYVAKNQHNNRRRDFTDNSNRQNHFVKNSYGLTSQFLQQLGITTPLCAKVVVTNLAPEVDEEKLNEVFNLAGKVIDVHLMRQEFDDSNTAMITFDHPVEAVQAISMFNNQSLCGRNINVCLNHKKNTFITLPPGLNTIGPGLGLFGRPLQYVRANVEIERIKHDIKQWLENISNTNQNITNTNLGNANVQPNMQSDLLKLFSTMANQINIANVNPNPAANQNVQSLLQGLLMQQANSVNTLNVQDTLQNVLGLMLNVGNEQTTQSLPPTQPFNNVPPQIASNVSNEQTHLSMRNNKTSHNMPNPPNIFNQQTPPNMLNQHKPQNFLNQQDSLNMLKRQNPPNMFNQQKPNMLNQQTSLKIFNQQTPLNMINQHKPQNFLNQQDSLNMLNRQNPPNMFNQQNPPNMFNQQNPPNMFNQHKPPNTLNQHKPPNMLNQEIPNKTKYQSEHSSRFTEEARNSRGKSDREYRDSRMGDMVVFKNLPPSVCIEALKSKMEEVGDIKFAEMTGDGKAIIRFAKESQAEKCIDFFDKCKVDGQMIEVRYV